MTTIALGDTHGRMVWKDIVDKTPAERIVFIGDYFDTHDDISAVEQMNVFQQIIEYKKSSGKEVIMLIGNHDHHYFPEIGDSGTSGYQRGASTAISHLLNENRDHLQMCYRMDNILFSHAGVSPEWLNMNGWEGEEPIDEYINDLWKHKPMSFMFNGVDGTGNNTYQTPIWIRPESLWKVCREWNSGLIQVVGHTQQRAIINADGRFWFIDCLGTSKNYLIITEEGISVGKL